jgi:hypothetical protein
LIFWKIWNGILRPFPLLLIDDLVVQVTFLQVSFSGQKERSGRRGREGKGGEGKGREVADFRKRDCAI